MQKPILMTTLIRLPTDLALWVEAQARQNVGSKTSEIVRCIRERKDKLTAEPNT